MAEPKLETELSRKAYKQLRRRILALRADDRSSDQSKKNFSTELYLLERISGFAFDRYPSYTAPWYLLSWPHMRWDHVFHVVQLIELMRQPTGAHVGAPIKLEPFQIFIILCFLGPEDPDTGLRIVREGVLSLARKQGKLKRLDEPVPTPRGWVLNGDLQEGDSVFGVDGYPCRVLMVSEVQTPKRAYRLTFSDGTSIETGEEHQWLTRHKWRPWAIVTRGLRTGQLGANGRHVEEVVTTQQIAESLLVPRPDSQLEYNHSIPLCAPVQYPPRDLLIDPYTLGVWLAEGSSRTPQLCLSDEDAEHIISRINKAYKVRVVRSFADKACGIYFPGKKKQLIELLRSLNLCENKHIPEDYLLGSVDQRLALLQGLMDGDGHATRHHGTSSTAEITQKRDSIAKGILALLRSLGLKPVAALHDGKINGKVVGQYHRIQFAAYRETGVFSLERKNNILKSRPEKPTRASRRQIVACEPVEPVPMRCIAVDGPNNLYLAGRDYIVTHNTAIVAALVVALMTLHPDDHGLHGQEIQVGAADREQSGITFKMATRYINQDEVIGISEKFHPIPSTKRLTHKTTLTELRCLSSEAYRAHGGNPVIVLLDEIGNVPAPNAREFYSVLTTGFGAQDEPLTLMFSTQAPTDTHFFSQQVDRAKRLNEGLLEDYSFAGFVFTLPDVDEDGNEFDIFDEKWWYLPCPGIDTIYSRKDMRDWAHRAKELPDLENSYRNLKLNQRVSMTSSFLTRRIWEKNNSPVDPVELYGKLCWVGIDLAETTDLAAMVLLFDYDEMGRQAILPFFWIPGEGLEVRSRRDKVPYDAWAKAGLIDVQSATTVDYGRIADKLSELAEDYNIQALGVDRWRWNQLEGKIKEKDNLRFEKDESTLFVIGQGFRDAPTSIELIEKDALEGKYAHGDNPILRWNIANTVKVKDAALNSKFAKNLSYGRIDGTIALAMARRARHEQERLAEGPSVYMDESREVFM